MHKAWIATLAAGCIVGNAIAEPSAPQAPPAKPGAASPAASGAPATTQTGAARGRTGKARNGRMMRATAGKAPRKTTAAEDALTSCIAMWDRRTHMTRQQWARACRRVADRLKAETR